jgi:choline kinase
VTDIGIVRGYQGQVLDRPGVTFFENPRWAETNMVRSLECAAAWLRESPCLVSYADIVYFESTVRALNATTANLALTFDLNWRRQWEARFGDPLLDAETFAVNAEGFVTDIGRRPTRLDEINGQYMGLLKITPDGWRAVEHALAAAGAAADRLDMTSLFQRLIAAGTPVTGVPVSDPWFEIDSQTDLDVCERELRAQTRDRAAADGRT